MRRTLKRVSAVNALVHVLDFLEQELIHVTDDEIREAAQDLGMDVDVKGSAAFLGLTYPGRPDLFEFFFGSQNVPALPAPASRRLKSGDPKTAAGTRTPRVRKSR